MSREVEQGDVDPLPRADHDVPRALGRSEPVLLRLHRRNVAEGFVQLDVVMTLTLSLASGRNWRIKLKTHISTNIITLKLKMKLKIHLGKDQSKEIGHFMCLVGVSEQRNLKMVF